MNSSKLLLLEIFILFFIMLVYINYYFIIKSRNLFKNNKGNVVIVLSIGYKKSNLNTFLITLKKQSPNSFLLLFSDNETITYVNEMYNNNGNVVGIELLQNYPYYPSNHSKYPISQNVLEKYIPLSLTSKRSFFYHTIRFFLANVWIEIYGNLFNSILLCDIKDIMFQNDPFKYYNQSSLYFQQEIFIREGKEGIIADDLNYEWIKPYHPNHDILINPIINSGQIMGNMNEMRYFISQFCDFMRKMQVNTAEQASLNYFLYSKLYKGKYISKKHGYGFALLLHYSLPRTKDDFTPVNNYFYNEDGTIPPIIHAYHLGFSFGSRKRREKYREFIEFHTKL